jgi:hypothetical protein
MDELYNIPEAVKKLGQTTHEGEIWDGQGWGATRIPPHETGHGVG